MTAAEYRKRMGKSNSTKHLNIKTEVDGVTFDSRKESKRWFELSQLQKRGEISELQRQTTWEFTVNNKPICKYIADFEYIKNGQRIVEDTKSEHTRKLPVYRIKKKLMAACYNIEIKET